MSNDGAPCTLDSECDGGLCLSEAGWGLPGGMCSQDCLVSPTCAMGSTCYQVDPQTNLCIRDCDPNVGCGLPDTLTCVPVMGAPMGGACVAYCDMTSDCTLMGNVCQQGPQGFCAPPPPPVENCMNNIDDDADSFVDCADTDCAANPVCASGCDTGVADVIGSQACSNCVNCSAMGLCQPQVDTYLMNPNSQAWSDCLFGDSTPQNPGCPADNPATMVDEYQVCHDACNASYPGVEPLYLALFDCIVCVDCTNNCDAATNCP